jgi:hypothetical protein
MQKQYLESSSNRNELLTALLESSVIITLMREITCKIREEFLYDIHISEKQNFQKPKGNEIG